MRAFKKKSGFFIVEVIVVLVLLVILTLVLMPALQSYILKSRREDAIKTILNLQISEEKYRASHTTYGSLANLGATTASIDGYYTMSISSNAATTFTIVATATGSQTSDTDCRTFTLTYANGTATKTSTNASSAPTTVCWN